MARDKMKAETQRLEGLRDRLIGGILDRIDKTRLNGHPFIRHPNNVNIALGSIKAEPLLMSLDAKGISCSIGSACDSTSIEPSHVLQAIGMDQRLARGSIRFSLGRDTAEEDVEYVLEVLPECVRQWRSFL
jgi:cysteine desulfurase